jgi:hypothetical protein
MCICEKEIRSYEISDKETIIISYLMIKIDNLSQLRNLK